MRYPVIFRHLTIFHNAPDWRYQIIKDVDPVLRSYQRNYEARVNSTYYKNTGAYLLRFLDTCDIDIQINPSYVLSDDLNSVIDRLDPKLRDRFIRIQHRQLRRSRQKKYVITPPKNNKYANTEWRLKNLEDIDDKWIVRMIKAFSGIEHDRVINEAIRMKMSPKHDEILRYIGYCIFLGKPDSHIARMWEIQEDIIEAMRMLFFDFTKLPKDTIAKMTFFRQMVVNGVYTANDFNFYKLLEDLGDTGLKAVTSFKLLNAEDTLKIESFYGTSMLENVLRLKLAVRNSDDAMAYSQVINQLGNFYMRKAEMRLNGARLHNLEASTTNIQTNTLKLQTDMGNTIKSGNEHEKLLESVKSMHGEIRKLSLEENVQPNYKPITELK